MIITFSPFHNKHVIKTVELRVAVIGLSNFEEYNNDFGNISCWVRLMSGVWALPTPTPGVGG